ncbi:hypothetical protein LTR56_022368 [Elasticomyces elasticus]|nr:hypothetical protein LTR56_022368 [Elasticomyces elasticus]KAK4907743.1 hypothetical protein LTR49_023274 [Elasticomyces elasticus]
MCKIFLDFYKFLASMPPYEPSDVLVPPERGWPSITPEKMSKLDKNHTVVDLLKHLPYLNMDRREKGDGRFNYRITYDTEVLDYRGRVLEEALKACREPAYNQAYMPPHGPFPAWVVAIASFTSRNGEYALLDTTDGTITRLLNAGHSYDATYANNDPRSWRDKSAIYFENLKREFEQSLWLPCWERGEFALMGPHDQKYDEVRHIYASHGWPNAFKREECGQALRQWDSDAN